MKAAVKEAKNATVEEVQELILGAFPGADVSGIHMEDHHIPGRFDWPGFRKVELTERVGLVGKKARDPSGLRGLNVDILFPIAPDEKL